MVLPKRFHPVPVLVMVLGLAVMAAPVDADIAGPVRVLHGDTLLQGDLRVHLQGVVSPPADASCTDAAGQKHPCGAEAAAWLKAAIGGRPVQCRGREFTHEGHLRALCFAGSTNLNGALVRAGWGLAEGRYGRWHEALEREAERTRAGLWADGSGAPWRWDW